MVVRRSKGPLSPGAKGRQGQVPHGTPHLCYRQGHLPTGDLHQTRHLSRSGSHFLRMSCTLKMPKTRGTHGRGHFTWQGWHSILPPLWDHAVFMSPWQPSPPPPVSYPSREQGVSVVS